jgi:hypothetical protein
VIVGKKSKDLKLKIINRKRYKFVKEALVIIKQCHEGFGKKFT